MIVTTRLREELDIEAVRQRYVEFASSYNPYPITCSMCGEIVFADGPSYKAYFRSLEYDPSNLFICDDCDEAALDEHR